MDEHWVPNFYNIFFRTTLGNVNIVSTYVCVAILLCGFLFVRYEHPSSEGRGKKATGRWRQPLWLAASALSFWMMEIGGSDSGRVGVMVATFLAIPFIVESLKTLGRFLVLGASWLTVYTLQLLFFEFLIQGRRTPSSLIFIAACVVVGLAGVEIMGRPDVAPAGRAGRLIRESREMLHGNLRDEMGTNRVYIWRNALEAFPNYPVSGSGPDTFFHAFPAEAHGFYGESYDKAHNEYIQILVCQGILGLLCYLVFLGGVFIKSIAKAFKNPLVMAVSAAFVGYCIQAFFNISLPIASQILWVLAGVLANKRVRESQWSELVQSI
jgi:O-antigen ligase